jgi:putative transposon-encoded protein
VTYVILMNTEIFEIRANAYGMVDKKVTKHGNSAHVYLPAEWVGKKVKVLLLEPLEEE